MEGPEDRAGFAEVVRLSREIFQCLMGLGQLADAAELGAVVLGYR